MRIRRVVAVSLLLAIPTAAVALAATESSDPVEDQVAALKASVLGDEPPSDPDDLRRRWAEFEQKFADLVPAAPVKDVELPPSAAEPYPLDEVGILEDGEDLPGFDVENSWAGYVDKVPVVVYAGTALADSKVGSIWVFRNGEPDGGPLAIADSGPVRITAADGSVLVLVDDAGNEVKFDASSSS
jgi:hypothetical protein